MAKVRLRDAPHPLRELFLLYGVTFLTTAVLTLFTQGPALRVSGVAFGGIAVLIGIAVLANFRGAADFQARLHSSSNRFNIATSKSFLARPQGARFGGMLFVGMGLFLIVGTATGPL